MKDKKNINTNKLTPEERNIKTPKTNRIKNTARTFLISALLLGPNTSKAQSMFDPANTIGYTNPASTNSPIHKLLKPNKKNINILNIKDQNLDISMFGVSKEKMQQIEKDFDAFFTRLIEKSDGNTGTNEILGGIKEIGKKHNLENDQLSYILMQYMRSIEKWDQYSKILSAVQDKYNQEEITEKTERIFSYTGEKSIETLCKEEFSKAFENMENQKEAANIVLAISLLIGLGVGGLRRRTAKKDKEQEI